MPNFTTRASTVLLTWMAASVLLLVGCGKSTPARLDRQQPATSPEDETPGSANQLADGMGMLKALAEPLREARDVRYEAKVVHVELGVVDVQTTLLMHPFGRTDGGGLQQNYTWHCRWRKSPQGELVLASILASDYEEIHARTGNLFAFVDCTESALGPEAYGQQLLSRGVDDWLERIETRYGIDPAGWQGIALGDVNGDGLEDVYVCQPGGVPNGLLLQSPDAAIAATRETGVVEMDFNGDGQSDQADVDFMVRDLLGGEYGDLDLNGQVDFGDFLTLVANFGRRDASWSDGDVDGDGEVGLVDFLLLSTHFNDRGLA